MKVDIRNGPLVSVYIPTYNRVGLLKRAVQSVRAQTYSNIEIIVVDDGSQDGTIDFLTNIQGVDSRITSIFKGGKNRGAPASRNIAIKAGSGTYVTGLDDDDYFHPRRIELLLRNYESRYAAIASNYLILSSDGIRRTSFCPRIISKDALLTSNIVGNQVLTERERILEVGGFDESLHSSQDIDLWLRLVEKFGPIKRIASRLYIVDMTHEKPRISTAPSKQVGNIQFMAKYREAMNFEQIQLRNKKREGVASLISLSSRSGLRALVERARIKLRLG